MPSLRCSECPSECYVGFIFRAGHVQGMLDETDVENDDSIIFYICFNRRAIHWVFSYASLEITKKSQTKSQNHKKNHIQKAPKSQITEKLLKNHTKKSLEITKITKNHWKNHVISKSQKSRTLFWEVICPSVLTSILSLQQLDLISWISIYKKKL